MKWPTVRLGQVCRVVPGFAFKSEDWSTAGIPVVKIKNIREDTTVDLSESDCVPPVLLTPRLSKFVLKNNNILVAMTGATAGKVGRLRTTVPVLLNQRVAKIAPEAADPRFIWSVVSSRQYQDLFFRLADGAAQPNMSGGQIEGVEIPNPPLDVQRRIGDILSAYDDLIENNTRRIGILEEMARRIYGEWFVRFRFPGHEGVRMVESELGLVPEGWDVARLDDVLVLQRGFDLPKQNRTEGPFPIISATGASATHREHRVKGPGVVTGRSGSLGTVMYVESDFWPLNTTLWVKEFVVGSALYAFYVLQSIDLAGFNSGAAVPTLNRNDVHGQPVLRPTIDVLARFNEVAAPVLKLKRRLELTNTNLRTTRDLLLPKLISGELDVSALPEPEAVAP